MGARLWLERRVPALTWLRGYERSLLAGDATAGAVVAVMVIPQGLAYAALAGMPPITGLYATIVPLVVYGALGSSAFVSVGPSAITALLVFSSLAPYAAAGPQRYVALAALLAVLSGLLRVAMGALRLGLFANFLSQPVLVGFTAAAALVIALSQLRELVGVDAGLGAGGGGSFLDQVAGIAAGLGDANLVTAALGLASIAVLLACRQLAPRVPGALVVTVAATLATWALSLDEQGVAILRDVPSGLPAPALPPLDLAVAVDLLPAALTLALIGYVEAVSVAKALAIRTRQRLRPNQELFALGWASVVAGLFRGFPIGGSLSRTAASFESGARTQASSWFAAALVALAAVALTPLLFHLPRAALAAIVVVAVVTLFSTRDVTGAFRTSRADGLALTVTFLATLLLPVQFGLLAGIGFSLLTFLWRATRPHMAELGRVEGTERFRKLKRDEVRAVPEVAILRLDGPLYFMNAETFSDRVRALWVSRADVRAVVIDTSAITGVDTTGVETLRTLFDQAAENDRQIHLATVRGPFRVTLQRSGLLDELLPDSVHTSVPAALEALEAPETPVAERPPRAAKRITPR